MIQYVVENQKISATEYYSQLLLRTKYSEYNILYIVLQCTTVPVHIRMTLLDDGKFILCFRHIPLIGRVIFVIRPCVLLYKVEV